MQGPSPDEPHPLAGFPQVGFLKPLVKNPNIVVGEYSYYDDPDGPEQLEAKCVLYHFPFVGDKLVIGKFCALARGRALHHERRQSPDQRILDVPLLHLRQWVGVSDAAAG